MSSDPTKSPPDPRPSATLRTWSIAFQLVLLFTIGAAGLVLFVVLAASLVVNQHVNHDNDRYIMDKLVAIQADMAADSGAQSFSQELKIIHVADKVYAVRVLDSAGNVVAESPDMPEVLPVEVFPKTLSITGQRPTPEIYHAANHKTFALVTAVADLGNQRLTLQLAQERTRDELFATRYAALLALTLVCVVLTCAGMAILVTRQTLRPLRHLAESMERTGATRLDERVPVGGWPDELQPLALGFNKMLDRLEDSFMRLSQFSADLAHDLRTPIGNLLGEAQVTLTRPRTAAEYQAVLASSVEELERINRMIDGMLFLARSDNVQASLDLQTFNAGAEVDRVIEYYDWLAADAGVSMRRVGELQLRADATLFRRAVANLVSNAIAHSDRGGEVTVAVRQASDGSGEVFVTNPGPGIPPQLLPRVFDRFFRADASRLDSAKGSGLGLAIVKSIVELHGGGIEAHSEPGALTTFRMLFPRATPPGATAITET